MKSHSFHRSHVHRNGTPSRYPKNSGGSPSGKSKPPQLHTTKMKKTTVCLTCFRSRLVSSSGRINSIAAPVVPMKLAKTAPAARNAQLTKGWAGRSPSIRMPPLMVYKLNRRTMNGNVLLENRVVQHFAGLAEVEVIRQRDRRQAAGHVEAVEIVLPPVRRGRHKRQHGNRRQQRRKRRDHPVGRMALNRLGRRRGHRIARSPLVGPPAGATGRQPPTPRRTAGGETPPPRDSTPTRPRLSEPGLYRSTRNRTHHSRDQLLLYAGYQLSAVSGQLSAPDFCWFNIGG